MRPKRLPSLIKYFGAKWRLAPKYPAPEHGTVIEPFAGGAGYSLLHYDRQVKLYDKSPYVVAVWRFLIEATREDILNLPTVDPGEKVSEMGLPLGAEFLIRSWLQPWTGGMAARDHRTSWGAFGWPDPPVNVWGKRCRQRIADHVDYLNHWSCEQVDDYLDIPDEEATWYIDPPYQNQGSNYEYSSKSIDFRLLGEWCRSRDGQVIVCENDGADWLPFEYLCDHVGLRYDDKKRKRSSEVAYFQGHSA